MKIFLLVLALFISANTWAEARGLECKSDSSSGGKDNFKKAHDTYWYRIDFDKSRVLYNSSKQNFLTKLEDLIGDKLRGNTSILYWRENRSVEVRLDRKTLLMTKKNLSYKCSTMTVDQVTRKRDTYFKDALKKNKI